MEDDETFLSTHLIELGREIAEHYACPLGITLKAMTPESVRRGRGFKRVRYATLAEPSRAADTSATRMTPQRRAVLRTYSRRRICRCAWMCCWGDPVRQGPSYAA